MARLRELGRRHRVAITVIGSLATAGVLVAVLAGRREQFTDALSSASLWVLAAASALQVLGLLSRTEAWHLTIEAAGGTVPRRILFRASSMQVLGGVLNAQLGAAARITALRRSSPELSPLVPTLVAAEFPILAVEITLAALASFTLVGPLGIPWWTPLAALAFAVGISTGLRRLALQESRELWSGLAVLRRLGHGSRVVAFMLLAIFCQVSRNWMLLHAVGVHASFWNAVAVLITGSTLAQLPVGPSVGAASSVLILGSHGVAAAAAAGVLMTVTGTVGGLCFAAWAGADRLLARLAKARAI